MADLKTQAELAAERVDPNKVGLDPVSILTILTAVLPLLAQCFNRNESPSPQNAAVSLRKAHERNPESLRRRTARRIRAEADEPMLKSDSFVLADAVIAQALETDDATVTACCMEAGE